MKMVELKNVGNSRISIRQVRGLALDPGESKKVPPATAAHPAVKRYIGRGLELVGAPKAEPKAPAPPASKPSPVPPKVTEPKPEPKVEPETGESEAPDDEGENATVGDLRESFLSAPGITEANVDEILDIYPSMEALADASKEDLCDLGVSKSYANRLISWANDKLND